MSFTIKNVVNNPPSGSISYYYGTTDPSGWIICDGQPRIRNLQNDIYSNLVTMNVGTWTTTTYTPPDLRGLFIRGAGTNGTTDYTSYAGSSVGTFQKDDLMSHTHTYTKNSGISINSTQFAAADGPNDRISNVTITMSYIDVLSDSSGNITFPVNVSLNFIIKL